jgi:glycosyltransferase involved in cell wall biosynthesis
MSWGGASKNSWILRSKLANGIILQNTDMYEFYPERKNLFLIPRGVDQEMYTPQPVNKSLQQKLGLSDEDQVIIAVANLVPVKGIEVLIEAFDRLELPKKKLLIVGDDSNDYGAKMKALVNEKGLSDHVTFTGKQPNVADYLSVSDLFVLPTLDEGRREGSPVSLLEALASGLPAIGSSVPGIKDQLKEMPEMRFEPGNATELSSRITDFFALSENKKTEYSEKVRQLVMDRFTIQREVDDHVRAYNSMLGNK